MAQTPEDGSDDDSRLELPSLSIFRRRKKQSDAEEPPVDDASDDSSAEEPEPLAELGSEADEPDLEEPATDETQPVQAAEPEAGLGTMFPNAVDDVDETADESGDEAGDEATQTLPVHDETATETDVHEGDDHDRADDADADETKETEEAPAKVRRERKELTLPALDARIAAPVTGLVVGLAGVALTFIGQRGCEAVKGTGSCGGVGLFLLIAILALMILLGATLLKAWQISDPTNSSFLAVGLVAVIAMLFFLPSIDTWYMVIVIPVLCALTYLLSWWVTRTFIENADET